MAPKLAGTGQCLTGRGEAVAVVGTAGSSNWPRRIILAISDGRIPTSPSLGNAGNLSRSTNNFPRLNLRNGGQHLNSALHQLVEYVKETSGRSD